MESKKLIPDTEFKQVQEFIKNNPELAGGWSELYNKFKDQNGLFKFTK